MASHSHRSLPYRPALDGLRGIAVTAVVIYHLNGSWAPGGWLGVDLFFVLSGFLITSLLLGERQRWGRIDLLGFWVARARRLLPSLVLMVLAVLVAATIWAAPNRRGPIGWDVFSSLFYVANWRLLGSDESYFAAIAMPSPVRHTWSLSIEEQYYLLFPLLLIGVCALTRNQRVRAAILLLLGLLSAAWMMHLYVPGVDPSRVYYGTDTRAFELLIGAAAGCLLGHHQFDEDASWRLDRFVGWASLPALAVLVVAFFALPEKSDLPYQGGLLVLAVLAVLPIAAASSRLRNPLQQLLSVEWLRRLGLISYSLYLWHWPVIVFANPSVVQVTGVPLAVLQVALSLALATLTYRYVEQPVRRRGFAALIPRRPLLSRAVTWVALPATVAGTLALGQTSGRAASVGGSVTLPVPTPSPSAAAVATPPTPRSTVLIGNSIPASLINHTGTSFPQLAVSNSVNFGCDPFPGAKINQGKAAAPSAACADWSKVWPTPIEQTKPDVALFFIPQSLVNDFLIDGRREKFATSGHDAFIRSSLESVRSRSLAAGAKHFAISTLSCHRMPDLGIDPELGRVNDDERVRHINQVATAWAAAHGVGVIDTFGELCNGGYHGKVNGVPLYNDGLHFTSRSAPIYWDWVAPQLLAIADKQ